MLAHQGGWDEILLVLGPIGVVVGLLAVVRSRLAPSDPDDDPGAEPGPEPGAEPAPPDPAAADSTRDTTVNP